MSKNYLVICIEDWKYRNKKYSDWRKSRSIFTWGAQDCYSVPEQQYNQAWIEHRQKYTNLKVRLWNSEFMKSLNYLEERNNTNILGN
jgi:hypothetical protein